MKALIFEDKVIDLSENEFPVSPEMEWIDVDPSIEMGWDVVDGTPVQPPEITFDLSEALEIKKTIVEDTQAIDVGGIQITADAQTRSELAMTVSFAEKYEASTGQTFSTDWEAKNGWFNVDVTTLISIGIATGLHRQKCFATKKAVQAQIDDGTLTTPEQVEQAFDTIFATL